MTNIHISATIKDQVYQILKQKICERFYKPGQWLQEKELAAYLSVSRSPVREALRLLSNDGLVVEIPNKGVFVREFTPKDIMDIFDMRNIMESYAIRHSQINLTEDAVRDLKETVEELIEAHKQDDLKLYVEIDTDLHMQVIELGGNSIICSTYERLRSMLQPFRIYSLLERNRFNASVEEHSEMVKYILDGEPEKAVAVNSSHLKLAQNAVLDYMAEKQEEKENA